MLQRSSGRPESSEHERRINVLLLLDSLMIGGMHKQMYYLAKYLDRSRFNVVVLTQNTNTGGLRQQYLEAGCTLVDLGRNSVPTSKKRFSLVVSVRLARVMRQYDIDVAFLNSAPGLIYFLFARLLVPRRVTLVGSFRALTFWKGHLNSWYKPVDDFFAKVLYKASYKTIVNANSLARHYSRTLRVSAENPLLVIENGSDFKFTITRSPGTIREELGLSSNEIAVIMAARLDPWKDFETLLHAATLTALTNRGIKYYLMGEGGMRSAIEQQIRTLQLERTVFLIGEKEEPANYINACDISVLATHGEGFSNAILESMYLETPVIATDVGGNGDVIGQSGDCGFLVERRSPGALAEKILLLSADGELRRRFGVKAKERIAALCSMDTYVQKYEDVFYRAAMQRAV